MDFPLHDDAAGRERSRLGGLVLLALGAVFAWQALDLPFGTAHRMGPGFFPLVVALAVAGLGLALVIAAPPIPGGALPLALRPLAMISLGVLAFALLIERAGLIPAAFVAVLLSGLSEGRPRPWGILLLAGLSALASWAVFGRGLGLPFTAFGG